MARPQGITQEALEAIEETLDGTHDLGDLEGMEYALQGLVEVYRWAMGEER